MTDRYAEGWRDACDAIRQELRGIAPEKVSTVLAAYQVRDVISIVRSQAVEETRSYEPGVESEHDARLRRYGLRR